MITNATSQPRERSSVSVVYSLEEDIDPSNVAEDENAASYIPLHPLGVKPAGNQYSATTNSRQALGLSFQAWPDEIIALFLDYLEPKELVRLGATCKFLYAFCRADDLWKNLFIE
jgi:hypothetical protein